jgi:phage tail-like protein
VARSENSDPLLAHNFALIDVPVPGLLPLAFPVKTITSAIETGSFIGFQAISMPEMTLETKQVKEGNWPLLHNIPMGFVNAGTVTLRQAVLPINTDMYYWFLQAMWGRVAPRRNLVVVHLRADKQIPQRMVLLNGCFPTSWRPSSDLDASGTEVVTEELTLQVGKVDFLPNPILVPAPNR